jgi:hypothetical protein
LSNPACNDSKFPAGAINSILLFVVILYEVNLCQSLEL